MFSLRCRNRHHPRVVQRHPGSACQVLLHMRLVMGDVSEISLFAWISVSNVSRRLFFAR